MKKRMKFMLALTLSISMALPVMSSVKPVNAAEKEVKDLGELNSALANAKNDDVIKLGNDLNLDTNQSITFSNNKKVSLDLNGHNVKKIDNSSVGGIGALHVTNGNLILIGKGEIRADLPEDIEKGYAYPVSIFGGTLTLNSDNVLVQLDGSNTGAAIKVNGSNSKLIIEKGTVSNGKSNNGAGEVFESENSGFIVIRGGVINRSNTFAKLIWGDNRNVFITGGVYYGVGDVSDHKEVSDYYNNNIYQAITKGNGIEIVQKDSAVQFHENYQLNGYVNEEFGENTIQIDFASGGAVFNHIDDDTDVTDWCDKLPEGLNLVKKDSVDKGSSIAWFKITGKPKKVTTENGIDVKVVIPAEFTTAQKDLIVSGKFNIKIEQNPKVTSFINTYVTKNNQLITDVTEDNYESILNGETTWNGFDDTIQGLVNSQLVGLGSESYVDLLNSAKTLVEKIERAKADAIAGIEKVANAKKDEIDKLDLTDEEKDVLKNKIDSETDTAKENINKATKTEDINTSKVNGLAAMNLVNAKAGAIAEINKAANAKKAEIDKLDLTDEEKENLIKAIDSETATAKENINKATKTEDINTSKDNGLAAIDLVKTKADAIAEINAAANAKKDEIDKLDLSDKEKENLIKAIDSETATAKENINKATKTEDINTSKAAGLAAMDLVNAKASAIAEINTAANAKKAEIDKLDLTDKEKDVLKNKIDTETATAKENINKATKTEDINTSKDNGLAAIDLVKTKADAIAEINTAADEKKKAIDTLLDLSDKEKDVLKNKIDTETATAKENINEATKTEDINASKDNGLAAIDLVNAKASAIAEINTAANAKKAEIDKLDLTDEEKDVLKNKIDTETATAKENINEATKTEDINTSKDNGLATIDLVKTKADAIAEINVAANAKKAEIDKLDLTDEEKDVLKNKIDTETATAKENINKATKTEDINTSKVNGLAAMNLVNAKASAIAEINTAANAKKDEIDKLDLTDEEKDVLKNKIDTETATAKENINEATDTATVNNSKAAGLAAMDLVKAKAVAMNEVDKLVNEKLAILNDLEFFSYEDRKMAIDNLEKLREDTKTQISNATSKDEIETVFSTAKENANTIIDEAIASDFVAGYLTADSVTVYDFVNRDNVDQILSGKDAWNLLTDSQKELVNKCIEKETNGKYKTYDDYVLEAETFVEENSNSFIKEYLTDEDGNIYKEATAENYKQILSGKEDWDNLSQCERDAINAKLVANGGKTYEELLETAQGLETSTMDFIGKYVSNSNGIYKEVNDKNYVQILSGKTEWNQLSQDQKDAINAKLVANGGKTYEELLATAEKVFNTVVDFIDKYVSDSKGHIYKDANVNNYKQILSGKATWESFTQQEKDAINAILLANGGKTYDELLLNAHNLKNKVETGDDTDIFSYVSMLVLSAGAFLIAKKRRQENM